MNRKSIIHILLAGALFLAGCKKDTDVFVPDPGQVNGPDTKWYTTIVDTMQVNVLRRNLAIETHIDSFEVNASPATINSSTGLLLTFTPNCCVTSAAAPVTGKVYAELMLIKKKGDMIRLDKPTISNEKLLVSGGEIFIRLKQNGQELKFTPNAKVQVRFIDAPLAAGMRLFYGDESFPDRFNWLPFDSSAFPVSVITQTSAYEFFSNRLNWINCDYFYNLNTSSQVKVVDSLPEHFTNANTMSYLVFNNLRSVVRLNADVVAKRFISGNLPTGLAATVVVISKQANDYYMAHESITTGGLGGTSVTEQKVKLAPVKTTLADIKAYLGTL